MNATAAAIDRTRAGLLSIPAYLTAVWDLGLRSLKPALPALGFLYFYRLGMGAYVALSDYSYPLGKDALGAILPQLAVIASFMPLLLLIYTPFLPLQDGLMRGAEMTFLSAIRRVFEESWNFMLSGIVQVLVFFIPFMVIAVVAGLMLPATAGDVDPTRLLAASFAALAGLAWAMIAGLFMIFATPALVLDSEGPVQSLRTSFHLVSRNLGAVLGRLFAFAFVATVVYFLATMPSSILGAVERSSGIASAPLKLAGVVWSSAVDTLFFPIWVAALMVLYRSLRPALADTRGSVPVAVDEEFRTPARAPFE